MVKQYTKDELWKLYDRLPEELKEAVFSQETADHIFGICERYEIDNVSEVARHVGLVLMGVLTPDELSAALQEEIGLEKTVAEKVAKEINRFVFYPVKPVLEQLHQIKSAPTENKSIQNQAPQPIEQLAPMKAESKEGELPRVMPEQQSQKSQETDPYREPIE